MFIGPFTAASGLSIATGIDLVITSGYATASDGGQAVYVSDPAVDAAYVAANPKTAFITTNSRGFRLSAPARDLDPRWFGAKCDGRRVDDAAMTSGSTTLTSASASFTASDVGKYTLVWLFGGSYATGGLYYRQIQSVTNTTTVVLSGTAPDASRASATCWIGTNDSAAIQAANAWLRARGGGSVGFPAGATIVVSADTTSSNTSINIVPVSNVKYYGRAGRASWLVGARNLFGTVGVSTQQAKLGTFCATADVSAGATGFTCSTPGDAANFVVGKLAWLRSNSYDDFGAGGDLPRFNELGLVRDANTTSGTVTLENPIRDSWSGLKAAPVPDTVPQNVEISGLSVMAGYTWYFGEGHYRCRFRDLWIECYNTLSVNAHTYSIMEKCEGVSWYTGTKGGRIIELKIGTVQGLVQELDFEIANVNNSASKTDSPIFDIGEFSRDTTIRDCTFDASTCGIFQVVTDYKATRSRFEGIRGKVLSCQFGVSASYNFDVSEAVTPKPFFNVDLDVISGYDNAINIGTFAPSGGSFPTPGVDSPLVGPTLDVAVSGAASNPYGSGPAGVKLFGKTSGLRLKRYDFAAPPAVTGAHAGVVMDCIPTVDVINQALLDNFRIPTARRSANGALKLRQKRRGTGPAVTTTTPRVPLDPVIVPPNLLIRPNDRIVIDFEGFGSPDTATKYLSAISGVSSDGVTWTDTAPPDTILPTVSGPLVSPFRGTISITLNDSATSGLTNVDGFSMVFSGTFAGASFNWVQNSTAWDNTKYHRFGVCGWLASTPTTEYIRFSFIEGRYEYLEENA